MRFAAVYLKQGYTNKKLSDVSESSGKVCYHARQVRQKRIEAEKTGS